MLSDFTRKMEAMMLGAMTSNVAPQPSEPFTMEKLNAAIASLGPPPPPGLGKIIESVHMVDRHEDWSKVRSPSRTLRRMRYNAARIYTYTPKKHALQLPTGELVMHPAMANEVRKLAKQKA